MMLGGNTVIRTCSGHFENEPIGCKPCLRLSWTSWLHAHGRMPISSPGAGGGPRSCTLTCVTVSDDTTSAPATDLGALPESPGWQQRREQRANGSLPGTANGLDAAAVAGRAGLSERLPAPWQIGSAIASRATQNSFLAPDRTAPSAARNTAAVAEEKRPFQPDALAAPACAASLSDQTPLQSAGAAAQPGAACSPASGVGATAALGGLTLAPISGSLQQLAPLPSSSQV